MKRALQIGSIFSFLCFCPSFAQTLTCSNKIDPQLCDQLKVVGDTDWVGFSIQLKIQSFGNQDSVDHRNDTTANGGSIFSDSLVVAETDSLFTTYEIRWPDTISHSQLAPYPTNTRASVPTSAWFSYMGFARKSDLLSMGSEDYIVKIWYWLPAEPASVSPLIGRDLKSPYKGRAFNLNGQHVDGLRFNRGPILRLKQ